MPTLRPGQQTILNYTHGTMGVAAVPGSGKTWTLSLLASEIIASGRLGDEQEVLVVTLVNSAVNNFARRVSAFLKERGLLPLGFRVRTLHGLAHDMVRERPALVGLSDDFQIIDEREADFIRDDVAQAWLQSNPYALDHLLAPDLDESRREWVRRDRLPELVKSVALSFIRAAKDAQATPDALRERARGLPLPLPLAEMGAAIYADYQRALAYRGAVDFDDLIRLALQALKLDQHLLTRLRERWPYILEDEAQDSSSLQEEILRLLAGTGGNWVRVGDPNQAIYETFTTADPAHLRRFRDGADFPRDLPESGRSTRSIIDLANHLVDWTRTAHPLPEARDALSLPSIQPAPPGDPQPNPPDDPSATRLISRGFAPAEEVAAVVDSIARWLPHNRERTLAVLAPRNTRGFEVNDALRKRGIETVDSLLRSTGSTRRTAGALGNLFSYLSEPASPARLATAFRVWRRADRDDPAAGAHVEALAKLLRKCSQVEDYLWPRAGRDWLAGSGLAESDPAGHDLLEQFRALARRWQGAALLPADQIALTLAQDLFSEPAELAVAHKLAMILGRAAQAHPEWRLPELTAELAVVARNERRFIGFDDDDTGFDPDRYRGDDQKVVIATVHKAKGLEWDRVYLMSVNNYDFPSNLPGDSYIPEKWFIRDNLNLEAEALAQLDTVLSCDPGQWYTEGRATGEARLAYVRERLRLLYVGITRARRELILTWNTGRKGDLQPALPFVALQTYLEGRRAGAEPEL